MCMLDCWKGDAVKGDVWFTIPCFANIVAQKMTHFTFKDLSVDVLVFISQGFDVKLLKNQSNLSSYAVVCSFIVLIQDVLVSSRALSGAELLGCIWQRKVKKKLQDKSPHQMLPAFEKVPGSFLVLHFPSPHLVKRSNCFSSSLYHAASCGSAFLKALDSDCDRSLFGWGWPQLWVLASFFDLCPLFSSDGKVKFTRLICLSLLMVNAEQCALHLEILWCWFSCMEQSSQVSIRERLHSKQKQLVNGRVKWEHSWAHTHANNTGWYSPHHVSLVN